MEIVTEKGSGIKRTLVYGEPGVGKTTFAAMHPNIVFIGDEPPKIEVPRLKGMKFNFEGMIEAARLLKKTEYERVAIDTFSGLEATLVKNLLEPVNVNQPEDKKHSIHTFGRGFGAGQENLLNKIATIVEIIEEMPKLKEIIFIAHSRIRTIELPDKSKINKIVPALETKVIEWLYRRSDCMYFIDIVDRTTKLSDKVVNEKKRIIYTTGTELFMAKNRFNLKDMYEFTGRKAVHEIHKDINKFLK